MRTTQWTGFGLPAAALLLAGSVSAQDASYLPQATQDVGYGSPYEGPASVGANEPLFRYDDQERWKHGYIRTMPYYEGYGAFRPYNYHHVFSQAQTSAGWGMPATMPYSQQFWHRYENMVDLSRGDHTPVAPYVPPPKPFEHYPKPLSPGAFLSPPPVSPMRTQPGTNLSMPQQSPSTTALPPGTTVQPTSNWTGQPLQSVPALFVPY